MKPEITEFTIKVTSCGNEVFLLIGEDLTSGVSGFGPNFPAALSTLASDIASDSGLYLDEDRERIKRDLKQFFRGKINAPCQSEKY